MSEELVVRFFSALEAGDIGTLREIYAPDAVIWHNDDLIEQPVEDNLKTLRGLHRVVSGLHYEIIRRVPAPDGVGLFPIAGRAFGSTGTSIVIWRSILPLPSNTWIRRLPRSAT